MRDNSRPHLSLSLSAALAIQLLSLGELWSNPKLLAAETANAKSFRETVQPFVLKYCVDCHGREAQNGGVNFEVFKDFSAVLSQRKTWEKAHKMLGVNAMPPADHQPRPSDAETAAVLRWIDQAVFDVDCATVHDPGHVTLRRLNRVEYNNTVRDLAGVTLRPADDFPSDDVGNGFDNMGDVLTLSPLLMERYLAAAERVSSVALFGVDTKRPGIYQFEAAGLKGHESAHLVDKLLGNTSCYLMPSVGSVSVDFTCPLSGRYIFRVMACARQAGEEVVRMKLSAGRAGSRVVEVAGDLEPARYELHASLLKGRHYFSAKFANYLSEPPAPDLPETPASAKDEKRPRKKPARELVVQMFEIEGPFEADPHDLAQAATQTRKRILICNPGADRTVAECATRILSRFATRAFRRPLEKNEIKPYVELVVAAAGGEPFDRAIEAGLTAILVSPNFLFRVERPGNIVDGTEPVPVGAYELASRLSYFLWSSMPDEELFRLAADGSLPKQEVLSLQVERMLHDAKAHALVENFAAQWLSLGQLASARPSLDTFRGFNEALRKDMRQETELFLESIVDEDRSIFDLLNGKYTFLNERLGNHYGIPGVEGPKFRRVSLQAYPRSGVLTQASILTLTSERRRTSPVKRGKWILETLLGSAPPPPPPNVPKLNESTEAKPKATLREQMAIHRKNAACATCHKVMDPLGFGLENFDGIGRWREKEAGQPVDASGTLPGGESFRGPTELVGILMKREDVFRRHLAKTLLTYALGRGLEYYDKCAVDQIVAGTRRGQDRFSVLVREVVQSEPFLKRRGDGRRADGSRNGP